MRAAVATAALTLLCACGGNPRVPDQPAAIAGSIVAHSPATSGTRATIHVKTTAAEPCGIVFSLDARTVVVRRLGDGRLVELDVTDLAVGHRTRVWADAIMESCPAQARAEFIEVDP